MSEAQQEDQQEAQHKAHVANAVANGECPYSGLSIPACKSWLCDCFEFEKEYGVSNK